MTYRLYTNEEVESISKEIDEVEKLVGQVFKGKSSDIAYNYFLNEYVKPIKGQITNNTESKTITNIEIILDKLKGLENAIKYKLQERDYANFAETYRYKNDLLNKLTNVYDLTNSISLRNLRANTIKQDLTELVNNLNGKMITFTYFQKKLNNLVLTHYTNKGDISFMFDIIPNLDMSQREK